MKRGKAFAAVVPIRNADEETVTLQNVEGRFPPEVRQELSRSKRLASEIVQDLLIANFPGMI